MVVITVFMCFIRFIIMVQSGIVETIRSLFLASVL